MKELQINTPIDYGKLFTYGLIMLSAVLVPIGVSMQTNDIPFGITLLGVECFAGGLWRIL